MYTILLTETNELTTSIRERIMQRSKLVDSLHFLVDPNYKGLDMSLFTALLYSALYVRQVPFDAALLPSNPLVWLGYVVLEALLVYFLGITPGKAMLGIQVRCVGEGSMTIGRSLSRACLVFVGGLGLMISVLPLIMMVFSLITLRKKGITMWDARCATLPLQMQPTKTIRRFLAVLVILVGFQLAGSCLVPWTEEMVTAVKNTLKEVQ